MSQVKAAILIGGPLDGKSIEVEIGMHNYMELPYDLPRQAEMDFNNPMPKISREPAYRLAIYKEQADGTHWKYYSG